MWNVKETKMRKTYLFKMLLQMSDGCESNIFLFMAGMQCHLWVSKKKHRNKGNYSY